MKVFKKSLAVVLAALMLVSVLAVVAFAADDAAAASTYVVAGKPELCGSEWNGTDEANKMELVEGLYTKVFKDVPVAEGYQFKIVKDGTEWIGINDQNATFNVTEVCDVTVTFNAETKEIKFEGKGVSVPTNLEIKSITAVGTGKNGFLKDLEWKQDAAENHMEGKDGVYTISYNDVLPGTYQVKFAANDDWADSWGVKKAEDTAEYPADAAVYNGDNIMVNVDAISNVTLTFDASKFDYATKLGATYSVKVEATGATMEPVETPAIVAGYYLTGSEGLFGTEWKNAADENTLMKKAADGTYFRDFTGIKAGEYNFKAIYVNARGDVFWHPDGMGNDVAVTVAADDSTVRITYAPFTTLADGTVFTFEPEQQYGQESPDTAAATVFAPGEAVPEIQEYVEPTEPAPTEPEKQADTTVKKKANPMKVKVTNKTYKVSKLKKKAQSFTAVKVTKAQGKVTYKVTKKNAKLTFKNGKVTVKKGTKKGSYTMKVKVSAAGKGDYKAGSKTVTIKVTVKK